MASPTTKPPHKRTLESHPSRITVGPPLSERTLQSDFTFDTHACWVVDPVPANATKYMFGSAIDTDITLMETKCSNGRSEFKTRKNGARTNLSIRTIEAHIQPYDLWTYTYLFGEEWIGDPYEMIMIPSSLEKCLPGPRSCSPRYLGVEYPDGHTALNTAMNTVVTSASSWSSSRP